MQATYDTRGFLYGESKACLSLGTQAQQRLFHHHGVDANIRHKDQNFSFSLRLSLCLHGAYVANENQA